MKFIAKVLCWVGIAASVYFGYRVMRWYNDIAIESSDEFYIKLALAILVGCFASWLLSIMLYGFGEIIENSRQQKLLMARMYFSNEEMNGMLDDELEDAMRYGIYDECDVGIDNDVAEQQY